MPISLRQIDPAVETVILPSGREIPVYPADAGAVQLIRELEQAGYGDEPKAILALRRLIPDATPEEIDTLTPPMVRVIVALGTQGVAAVEAMLGESSGGREATVTSPSSPETGTDTSVNG